MPEPFAHARSGAVTPARLRLAGVVALLVAAVLAVWGLAARYLTDRSQQAWSRDQAVPTVGLVKLSGGGVRDLVLPGDVQAFNTAPIHARVSGYLKRWDVDIGAHVKAGQVLAEVDTPDLDQQVLQARADLATAQANQALAATTAKRWQGLVAQDAVSRQEADEKAGDLVAKTSLANSQRANLNRLLALESFKRITSPFAGVVTSRTADIGQLITSGGDAVLFTVADQRRLRVYVRVPQNYSAQVHAGTPAEITVPEFPGQKFAGVVTTAAPAVGAQTGAVLTELQLDNADGRLKSGEYAQVNFKIPAASGVVRMPATAVLFRQSAPNVVIVGSDNRVRVRPITIARDFGPMVEIGSGVSLKDRVIDNPPEAMVDGDIVRVAKPKATGKDAASAPD